MYSYGGFTLLYGRNKHNSCKAIILQLKINLEKDLKNKVKKERHMKEILKTVRCRNSTLLLHLGKQHLSIFSKEKAPQTSSMFYRFIRGTGIEITNQQL